MIRNLFGTVVLLTSGTAAGVPLPNGIALANRQRAIKPWWRQLAVTIYGWSGPARVRVVLDVQAKRLARSLRPAIPDQPVAADFVLSRF